ncbi:ABC transporter permease [Streptacidiphilus jiangxiensis]|uniref:Transport permease protein n=1 Tax=Streptacidiphilus jiangxiensis TaxID=235985 RepID=A0A1H8ARB4_STRJI|nr:teichoic acid transport system permease protein [Streptacidiphilus jiangxiensis]
MSTVFEQRAAGVADPDAGLSPAELAAKYGLTISGRRPSLVEYTKQVWQRRYFIGAYATAKLMVQYSSSKLGQVWQVLTPLLNAGVYFLIFDLLLGISKGIPDYIPYLCTGVFVFNFTQAAVLSGTRAISDNLGLIRALHFPRASLPIAFTVNQLQQLVVSMGVLGVIVLVSGLPITVNWLLIVPVLLLQATFNAGLAMFMARIGAKTSDMAQLMPFIIRTWMYLSGVFWSVSSVAAKLPHVAGALIQANPALIYIELMRYSLMDSVPASSLPHHVWIMAVAWAVVGGLGGYVFFWKAEEEYGRG